MSAEALPIDPAAFAEALESLPVDTLHERAAEIRNSINHLKYSNEQMMPFADDGDEDCKEALFENLVVLNRMNQRITILRAEVEKRGMRWADAETEEAEQRKDVDMTDAEGRRVNGHVVNTSGSQQGRSAQSGRLTDEDLRRRLQDQMEEDDDDGVHL